VSPARGAHLDQVAATPRKRSRVSLAQARHLSVFAHCCRFWVTLPVPCLPPHFSVGVVWHFTITTSFLLILVDVATWPPSASSGCLARPHGRRLYKLRHRSPLPAVRAHTHRTRHGCHLARARGPLSLRACGAGLPRCHPACPSVQTQLHRFSDIAVPLFRALFPIRSKLSDFHLLLTLPRPALPSVQDVRGTERDLFAIAIEIYRNGGRRITRAAFGEYVRCLFGAGFSSSLATNLACVHCT